MTPQDLSDHAQHDIAVVGCFRCRISDSLTPVAKDAMRVNMSFRVPEKLRKAANDKAVERHENISDVLRAALEEYAYGDAEKPARRA